MDAKTLEALKASIAKWERNAKAEYPEEYNTSAFDCPLCQLFLGYRDACRGCPVASATGLTHCNMTPYKAATEAALQWDKDDGEAARDVALGEVAFLKSLLPEGEQP